MPALLVYQRVGLGAIGVGHAIVWRPATIVEIKLAAEVSGAAFDAEIFDTVRRMGAAVANKLNKDTADRIKAESDRARR